MPTTAIAGTASARSRTASRSRSRPIVAVARRNAASVTLSGITQVSR